MRVSSASCSNAGFLGTSTDARREPPATPTPAPAAPPTPRASEPARTPASRRPRTATRPGHFPHRALPEPPRTLRQAPRSTCVWDEWWGHSGSHSRKRLFVGLAGRTAPTRWPALTLIRSLSRPIRRRPRRCVARATFVHARFEGSKCRHRHVDRRQRVYPALGGASPTNLVARTPKNWMLGEPLAALFQLIKIPGTLLLAPSSTRVFGDLE